MGSTIAGEIGVFGYRPSMLMDMLAGKRVEGGTKVGAYMRTFSGDCSPSDLETALQVCFIGLITSISFSFPTLRLLFEILTYRRLQYTNIFFSEIYLHV